VMLLALDVGNTQTVAGLYEGRTLREHWRTATVRTHTGDELALTLVGLLKLRRHALEAVEALVVASSVPQLSVEYAAMSREHLGRDALVVGPGIRTGVALRVDNPLEVGPDRVANSVAAHALYGGPCIVVDFGTAINFDAVSAGGDFVYTQVGFVTLDTAINFLALNPPGQRTFFVIKLKDGIDVDSAAARPQRATPGVKFIKPADFAHETRKRILGNILPILIVVLIISFIVGLAVAGLTIYTATIEKAREYGILKAEGFTNRYLYRLVFEQSLVTGLLGFLLGAGLTIIVAPFAQQSVPQFVVFVRWQDISAVAGTTLVMSLLAAYIPIRRLTSIDPVSVFKG